MKCNYWFQQYEVCYFRAVLVLLTMLLFLQCKK
nr:MAG TPA: hypothetical protein [Caudoviricetes sp.]